MRCDEGYVLGTYTIDYWRYHIPTFTKQLDRLTGVDHLDCLKTLDDWNSDQPGVWQYWWAATREEE